MIEASKKISSKIQKRSELQQISFIYYPTQFGKFLVETFINSDNKINAMQPSYAKELDFRICKTNVIAQKIDSNKLKSYKTVIDFFQVDDKDEKFRFSEKTFLLADIIIKIALKISFLILSNIEVNFNNREFKQRLYIAVKVFCTGREVKLNREKTFLALTLDSEDETFVVHVLSLMISNKNEVYLFCKV